MRLVDLSHPIHAGLRTAPNLPVPQVSDHLTFEASHALYEPGTEFLINVVHMATGTGTYLDAPRHRFRDGSDVATVPLQQCTELPAIVIDAPASGKIDVDVLPDDLDGHAVLFRTGWDEHWQTDRYGSDDHPHLAPQTASELIRHGVVLVGIDSVNVDGTSDGSRPIHTMLLGAGVLIVENLTNLAALPARGVTFSAAPLAFEDLPSIPVRAYARL